MSDRHEVLAPLPGVFYRRPEPEASQYVEVGTRVGPDDTVALIEVMKQFFEVKAGVNGEVIEILVEDQTHIMASDLLLLIRLES